MCLSCDTESHYRAAKGCDNYVILPNLLTTPLHSQPVENSLLLVRFLSSQHQRNFPS